MPDDIDFKQAMQGVRRLNKKSVHPARVNPPSKRDLRTRIKNRAIASSLPIDDTTIELASHEATGQSHLAEATELFFLRAGLQNKILRELKKGKRYPIERELDLHGLTQAKAQAEIDSAILALSAEQSRCLLIVHGKGLRSSHHPVLKTFTAQYLKTLKPVSAYCSAQTHDGGTGALYVLIKT